MSLDNEFDDLMYKFAKDGYDDDFGMALDVWIKYTRYKDLYTVLTSECSMRSTESESPYIEALLRDNEITLYKNYWKSCLKHDIESFWSSYGYWKGGVGYKWSDQLGKNAQYTFQVELNAEKFLSYDKKILEENKEKYPRDQDGYLCFVWEWHETLEFIDAFIEAMQKIDAQEETEKALLIKESIYHMQKPKPKKTTDKRKMDENLFWELIKESQKASEYTSEFLDVLQNKLEAMSTTEIKKFQKYLLEKMKELNHWDIWALAYIVRNGCGDDEFDYFRAWVISRGEEIFKQVKTMQIDKLKDIFSQEDPQLEKFFYIAQEAYENKKGEMMSQARMNLSKIQGIQWSEENICTNYSKLCEIFNYN